MIALCIGHSRLVAGRPEGGARSVDGTSEWDYNKVLASLIASQLRRSEVPCLLVDRYEGRGYGSAMRWLGRHLREVGATRAVELHFNAGGGRGHEWLHWAGSDGGEAMARRLEQSVATALPELPRRGVKPRGARDRGALFLRRTHCPAVIAEPFFGDSRADWQVAQDRMEYLAVAMAAGMVRG